MRKKLVITVVAVAATLLALSPLALAADAPAGPAYGIDRHRDDDQFGLVNVGDLDLLDNVCPDVGAGVGILGILGHRGDDGDITNCVSD